MSNQSRLTSDLVPELSELVLRIPFLVIPLLLVFTSDGAQLELLVQ